MYFYRLIKQAEYDFDICVDSEIDSYTQNLIDALKIEDFSLFERLIQNCPLGTKISDYLDVYVKPFNSTIKDKIKECCDNGFGFENWQNLVDFYL